MPYAVTLRLDADTGTAVEAMWREAAGRAAEGPASRPDYPPH